MKRYCRMDAVREVSTPSKGAVHILSIARLVSKTQVLGPAGTTGSLLALAPTLFSPALGSTRPGSLLPAQAQEYLLRVLRLQPDNKEAWEELGQCYLETGSLENSLEAYRRAVALVKGSDDSSGGGGK